MECGITSLNRILAACPIWMSLIRCEFCDPVVLAPAGILASSPTPHRAAPVAPPPSAPSLSLTFANVYIHPKCESAIQPARGLQPSFRTAIEPEEASTCGGCRLR